MALANFFNKAALAASQILQGYNTEAFEQQLLDSPIEIAFDDFAINSHEGRATLDLTIRLAARLYPVLVLTANGASSESYKVDLISIAQAINPQIEIIHTIAKASIVVGATKIKRDSPVFYIGSDNWLTLLSDSNPVLSGQSDNPLAAGAAACLAAANAFRVVFGNQLPNGNRDKEIRLSLIDFSQGENAKQVEGGIASTDLGEAILVGIGAIGNGALWAIKNIPKISGIITAVDDETIDLSNLQRYVLTDQHSVTEQKAEWAASLTSDTLCVKPYAGDWSSFVSSLSEWNFPAVLVAVDSAEARIAIQSSLPAKIYNAWTQSTDLGVSRHLDFLNDACLACLYPPRKEQQTESEIVASALGLIGIEPEIRRLLYYNAPVNEPLIQQIAGALSIPAEILLPFRDLPIREFYRQTICGNVTLSFNSGSQAETPMAFQSALAGILLISELIIEQQQLRKTSIATSTRIDLLRPLQEYLEDPVAKGQYCLCLDEDFKSQFIAKYR
ncbi:MAG: hypothetical protein BGO70_01235 [Bacteroidetes bacterium 43-93]|uniref:E2 ligase fold family C protein n=1 Tax=uncultured Dysgonomonas sp. TaxID=206096 RepID=UPI00092BEC5C|nr:E2 ligase fold family C protein [uncultured Dysgonomonas sp.]MBN9483100.1 E2 ligase fold family C protein [Bacteroidota bacterium]OJW96335.1 MAG: hypothetical protein BGO70_01235 [Bacteroidetes bacterium 43-93]